MRALGGWGLEARVAAVLVERIPLPWDPKLTAAARALQVMGVQICAVLGDLDHCECLHDLARQVGVDEIRDVLLTAMDVPVT